MEAPKKIYIDDFGSELSFDWHTEHSYEKDIEYVRKDVFIKRIHELLLSRINDIIYYHDKTEFINDFLNDIEE